MPQQNAHEWDTADRISDVIVDTINKELVAMQDSDKMDVMQLLAGQLLGLMASFKTMPPLSFHPTELVALQSAVRMMLHTILSHGEPSKEDPLDPGHSLLVNHLSGLLQEALGYAFHDTKNTQYATPKVALYRKLSKLAENVKRGDYDND